MLHARQVALVAHARQVALVARARQAALLMLHARQVALVDSARQAALLMLHARQVALVDSARQAALVDSELAEPGPLTVGSSIVPRPGMVVPERAAVQAEPMEALAEVAPALVASSVHMSDELQQSRKSQPVLYRSRRRS
jgi:hypothetical protein